jgi:hypothetical protein
MNVEAEEEIKQIIAKVNLKLIPTRIGIENLINIIYPRNKNAMYLSQDYSHSLKITNSTISFVIANALKWVVEETKNSSWHNGHITTAALFLHNFILYGKKQYTFSTVKQVVDTCNQMSKKSSKINYISNYIVAPFARKYTIDDESLNYIITKTNAQLALELCARRKNLTLTNIQNLVNRNNVKVLCTLLKNKDRPPQEIINALSVHPSAHVRKRALAKGGIPIEILRQAALINKYPNESVNLIMQAFQNDPEMKEKLDTLSFLKLNNTRENNPRLQYRLSKTLAKKNTDSQTIA